MRDFNRGSRGGGFGGGGGFRRGFGGGGGFRRQMHKATCSKCNKECEVPFKPTEGRPVYCRECFAQVRDNPEAAEKPKKKLATDSEESEEDSEQEFDEETEEELEEE